MCGSKLSIILLVLHVIDLNVFQNKCWSFTWQSIQQLSSPAISLFLPYSMSYSMPITTVVYLSDITANSGCSRVQDAIKHVPQCQNYYCWPAYRPATPSLGSNAPARPCRIARFAVLEIHYSLYPSRFANRGNCTRCCSDWDAHWAGTWESCCRGYLDQSRP